MNYVDFSIFTELEKLDAVLRYGHLLSRLTETDSRIFLYQVESFYVILRYTINDDQLQDIRMYKEIGDALPNLRKPVTIHDPSCRVVEVESKRAI